MQAKGRTGQRPVAKSGVPDPADSHGGNLNQTAQTMNSNLPGRQSAGSFRATEKKSHSSKAVAVPSKLAAQSVEEEAVLMENELLREKVKELEKWLVLLLNNFYEGNPASLRNIENVRVTT